MALNLITDPWIPAVRARERVVLRPHEIASEDVAQLDWPRADLNLACLELLIGLLFLADPPRHDGDWQERYDAPDAQRLRAAFEPFAPHFELTGNGPRFLQDWERFESGAKPTGANPPDMLFIDSAGESTRKHNADLMVKRDRYRALSLPLAAMALYTLQAFAPAGGAGNRTSMRGGGPLMTLVQPLEGGAHRLWRLLWSNVPEGLPLPAHRAAEALPWLRPTRTSQNNETVTPAMSHPGEAFFAMPRRLRLLFTDELVSGVAQKKHGTNYALWTHPLTPYYREKPGAEPLPVHPKPGKVSYRNWLGLAFGEGNDTRSVAASVHRFHSLSNAPEAELLAGGWAMSNMKPVDFSVHAYPSFRLESDAELRAGALVEAANAAVGALMRQLKAALKMRGQAADAVREAFFAATETNFVAAMKALTAGLGPQVEDTWLGALRRHALRLFDQETLPTLTDRSSDAIEATVEARRQLLGAFSKASGVRKALGLPAADQGVP